MKLLFALPFLFYVGLTSLNKEETEETFTVFVEVTHYQPDGYAAKNLSTNEWIYTERGQNFFENLPEGTYRFTAYEGYFCGASSKTVTISDDIAVNGEITVELSGWCE
ncbi:hypothetical protein ED312_02845 [Sinomicrobium pectinilyticum]|uniref:Carboxypeptidase regulatory-like domain-containing protein n=1 Tax=Sinomicrobium pectinilyticum TaxID=1084421 RepID=A0A3N0EYQ1_SINP1|nr:hypothetical protein [Sinomicrobium pectinilyticum]RNL92965.1 hypothetical protein ED312_02845 [Sinomicrobium pectinilyticum]